MSEVVARIWSVKKVFLKKSLNSGETVLQLYQKDKRLRHGCFLVIFAKFSITYFSREHLQRLLLKLLVKEFLLP